MSADYTTAIEALTNLINNPEAELSQRAVQSMEDAIEELEAAQSEVSKIGQPDPIEKLAESGALLTRNGLINEHGYPIYPAGTPVSEVNIRDRSQKMVFQCKLHPEVEWASKDPFVSRWFATKVDAQDCQCETPQFVLSQEYSPTRND